MRARLVMATMVGLVAQLCGVAHAGDPATDAADLAGKGDFIGAAAKFREAYAADPKPELMCNVGVAYYKGNDYPHAYRYLDQCLAAGTSLDKSFLDSVRAVVAAVDTKLRADLFAPIDIAVEPATATTLVEYGGHTEEPIVGSRRLWVPFGHYKLTMHAEGFTDKIIEGEAKTHDPIAARAKLEPKPAGGNPDVKPPPPPDGNGDKKKEPLPPPPPPATHAGSAVTAGVVTGVALLGGAFGVASFIVARGHANDAGGETDKTKYDSDVKSARNWQHLSWVGAGVGGAAAIVAGYFWYRVAHTSAPVEVAPTSGGGATVSIGFTF